MRFLILLGTACIALLFPRAVLEAQTLRRFQSPEEAADALRQAVNAESTARLASVVGPTIIKNLLSGDSVADKRAMGDLAARMNKGVNFRRDERGRMLLFFGQETEPFAVPLITSGGIWVFDDTAGQSLARSRVIERNSSKIIELCLSYIEAQNQFFEKDTNNDGVNEYAQRFFSSPGQKDGLYAQGESSPIREIAEEALKEGYKPGQSREPVYRGYYFHLLMGQGDNAPGGAKRYTDTGGRLTKGFGLLAYPTRWNVSGTMTYMVSGDGLIYQKNLGSLTPNLAPGITIYDPDPSWRVAPVE